MRQEAGGHQAPGWTPGGSLGGKIPVNVSVPGRPLFRLLDPTKVENKEEASNLPPPLTPKASTQ